MTRRSRWLGPAAGVILLSPFVNCMQALQNELEVIFAFDAVGNSLLLPKTIFGQILIEMFR